MCTCYLCDAETEDFVNVRSEGTVAPTIDVCEDCYEDNRINCDFCGENFVGDCGLDWLGNTVCASCLHDYHFSCESCGSYVDESSGVRLGSGTYDCGIYCPDCANDYGECAGCGDVLYIDNLRYSERDERDYCEMCYDENAEEIHQYGYRPSINFLGRPENGVYYGIELEVECTDKYSEASEVYDNLCDNEDYAVLKEDGSLNYGFEIATQPATVGVHKAKFGSFLDNVPRGLKSYNTTTCGIHIHVSRSPLTKLQVGKMLGFVYEPENRDLIRCVAQRNACHWGDYTIKKKVSDAAKGNYDHDRYEAINLTNHATIEFRIFKGTLNKRSFLKNLEFVEALVEFTATARYSIREMRTAKFMEFVKQTPERYPNLIGYLTEKMGSNEEEQEDE